MSENSLWLVPNEQEACAARVWEIAERLWDAGIAPMLDLAELWRDGGPIEHLGRTYDYFHKRAKEWKASGRWVPKACQGDFDTVWITCLPHKFLIPATAHQFCDLRCPHCHGVVAPTVDSPDGGMFGRTMGAVVRCRRCENTFPAAEIEFNPSQVAWTRFSVSFHDMANCEVPVDEPWVNDVTDIIGPSRQFRGWET